MYLFLNHFKFRMYYIGINILLHPKKIKPNKIFYAKP